MIDRWRLVTPNTCNQSVVLSMCLLSAACRCCCEVSVVSVAYHEFDYVLHAYVLICFLFRKTNRNYGQVLTTVKYRLNVTEQTVHACVHPPYHDPPGVSASLQAVVSVRC